MNLFLPSFFSIFIVLSAYSQIESPYISTDSISINSKVEFFTYIGAYGSEDSISEPVIKFILTVYNHSSEPIPDLAVINRSNYVNFFVDNINPLSLYNGIEIIGKHIILPNESDTYIWWLFTKDAYSNQFIIQWQYLDLFSKKINVGVKKQQSIYIEGS